MRFIIFTVFSKEKGENFTLDRVERLIITIGDQISGGKPEQEVGVGGDSWHVILLIKKEKVKFAQSLTVRSTYDTDRRSGGGGENYL